MNITIKNEKLNRWIKEVKDLCQPEAVYICNGSKKEYDSMINKLIEGGIAIPLRKRPNSFLFRSDPSDVARVEDNTYISTTSREEAGPTNNWIAPIELKKTMLAHPEYLSKYPNVLAEAIVQYFSISDKPKAQVEREVRKYMRTEIGRLKLLKAAWNMRKAMGSPLL